MKNEAAIFIRPSLLVIGDLHIGILGIRDIGVSESIIDDMITRLEKMKRELGPSSLIITGDVKERIGLPSHKFEIKLLEKFFSSITRYFSKIYIAKGNHDGKLEFVLKRFIPGRAEVYKVVSIFDKLRKREIIILHGHFKLSCERIKRSGSEVIVISSHTHPALQILPSKKVKVWVLSDILACERKLRWIILPAFNDTIMGADLSKLAPHEVVRRSPFPSQAKILKESILLLDLTPIKD